MFICPLHGTLFFRTFEEGQAGRAIGVRIEFRHDQHEG